MSEAYNVGLHVSDDLLRCLAREAAEFEDSDWAALKEILDDAAAEDNVRRTPSGHRYEFSEMTESEMSELVGYLNNLFVDEAYLAIVRSSEGDVEFHGSAMNFQEVCESPLDGIDHSVHLPLSAPSSIRDNPIASVLDRCRGLYGDDMARRLLDEASETMREGPKA